MTKHEHIKKLVANYRDEFMDKLGFNRKQATSLAWNQYYEFHSKGYILGTLNLEFHCSCHTCNKHNIFRAADTIRLFINEHKDHKTWTMVVR